MKIRFHPDAMMEFDAAVAYYEECEDGRLGLSRWCSLESDQFKLSIPKQNVSGNEFVRALVMIFS